ncbi:MAG: hypothetical protein GY715_03355 [Planctomycetes bacterium]|nr:hypothetical protein [Planctomycetota bacterium]
MARIDRIFWSLAVAVGSVVGVARAGDGPDDSLLTATFDGGQTGDLAPAQVTRGYATIDPTGAAVTADGARYESARVVASLGAWEAVSTDSRSVISTWCGFDRDDATPVLAMFDSFSSTMEFWIGDDVAGPATFTIDMRRNDAGTTVRDALNGDPLQLPHHAYEPKAGTVLPGTFVFLCERKHDVNEDPGNRDWQAEGVSLLTYRHLLGGGWQWSIEYDGPPLGGDATALGWKRLRAAALQSYYPRELGSPLLSAFIPFVDYINDSDKPEPKKGGQLFIVEATRASAAAEWSFGPTVPLYESIRDGEHFHSAGWTPRGVVLGIGDGQANSEVKLFTCSDWDAYDDLGNWTRHDGFHGVAAGDPGPELRIANQFWGCIPGHDLNTLIVGADLLSGSHLEITVPVDPADGATFTRLHGQEIGTGANSNLDFLIGEWMHRPAPERSTAVVARVYHQAPSFGAKHSRILFSDDARNFTTIARVPTPTKSPVALLYGDSVVVPYFNSFPGSVSIHRMTRPVLTAPRCGLAVGPGGTNHLWVSSASGQLTGFASTPGATRTFIQPGGGSANHPVTGAPLNAPTLGPVYRLQRAEDAPGTTVLDVEIAGPTASLPPGTASVSFWVNIIGPEGVWLTAELTDGSTVAEGIFKLAERDQWVRCVLSVDTSDFVAGYVPRLRLGIADNEAENYACDFLVAVEAMHANEYPGYPIAPINGGVNDGSAYSAEHVAQPLPALGPEHTIELSMRLPATGFDESMRNLARYLPLATIWGDADEHLRLEADLLLGTLLGHVTNGGVVTETISVPRFVVKRLDQVWIRAAFTGSAVNLYALCGGSTAEGIAVGTAGAALATTPTEVRFGDASFGTVAPLEILSIAVAPNSALGGEITDCDHDGVADSQQILLFPELDLDGNGILDICEVDADLNDDGTVNFGDIIALIALWGDCVDPPTGCPGDLDENGNVGFSDLLIIIANWS